MQIDQRLKLCIKWVGLTIDVKKERDVEEEEEVSG